MGEKRPKLTVGGKGREAAATLDIGGTEYSVPRLLDLPNRLLVRIEEVGAEMAAVKDERTLRKTVPSMVEFVRLVVPEVPEEVLLDLPISELAEVVKFVQGGYSKQKEAAEKDSPLSGSDGSSSL